jgi:hypothetical protein
MDLQYAIRITNDEPYQSELWGPYNTEEEANQVKAAYVGVPESAVIVPVQSGMHFTGCPM